MVNNRFNLPVSREAGPRRIDEVLTELLYLYAAHCSDKHIKRITSQSHHFAGNITMTVTVEPLSMPEKN